MKYIIVLTSSYPNSPNSPDGGGTFVKTLCQHLSNQFKVHILTPYVTGCTEEKDEENLKVQKFKYFFKRFCTLTGGNGIAQIIKENPVNIIKLPFFFFFQFFYTLKAVKRTKSKFIHIHWVIPQGITAVLVKKTLRKSNIKLLLTVHGSDFNSLKKGPLKRVIIWVFNNVDEITVVSQALKTEIEDWGIKQKIHVYPMGIDTKLFTPNPSTTRKVNQILFVSYLIKEKGLEDLIEAIPEIVKNVPDFELKVIGPGNNSAFVIRAQELNVQAHINWIGEVPNNDLPQHFRESAAFILPSHSEGFGIVCIEAMACNCITLVSKLPATKDYIKSEKTGFFIEAQNSSSISKQIIHVLTYNSKLGKVRKNARNFVVNNFDWEAVSENYAVIINEMTFSLSK